MKKILLAMLILLMLASGCAKKQPSESVDNPDNQKPSLSNHTAAITETTAPQYFIPTAILPDGTMFGTPGGEMATWNPQTGEAKVFGNAWSAILSPDGKKAAFTDEQGLSLLDLHTGSTYLIAEHPTDDSSLEPGVWSPESDKLIYMFVREWSSDYHIYNTQTGENAAYEFNNLPDFLSRPVDWLENGLIFVVHANKSKSGEQEYRENGYRADLMLGDNDGNFTSLTNLDDGSFAMYNGASSDGQTMLVIVWEQDGETFAGLIENGGSVINNLPAGENAWGGTISPNGKFAVLISSNDEGNFSARVLDLTDKAIISEYELGSGESPRNFLWQEDSHTVHFGMPGSDNNGILYTITIQ